MHLSENLRVAYRIFSGVGAFAGKLRRCLRRAGLAGHLMRLVGPFFVSFYSIVLIFLRSVLSKSCLALLVKITGDPLLREGKDYKEESRQSTTLSSNVFARLSQAIEHIPLWVTGSLQNKP